MENKPFMEKDNKPDEKSLELSLKEVFQYYKDLKALSSNFKSSWSFYKSSGWLEKIADKKKALYYFVPHEDSFLISLTIRPAERELFLTEDDMKEYHRDLETAKKYPEGYHIQFLVSDKNTYQNCKKFINRVIQER